MLLSRLLPVLSVFLTHKPWVCFHQTKNGRFSKEPSISSWSSLSNQPTWQLVMF